MTGLRKKIIYNVDAKCWFGSGVGRDRATPTHTGVCVHVLYFTRTDFKVWEMFQQIVCNTGLHFEHHLTG